MDFLIVTGMSGAGKSQAIDSLEDMGFYCVDNVPPSLLIKFAELPKLSNNKVSKIAVVVDVRSRGMYSDYLACLEDLRLNSIAIKTLFLDCDDKVIQTRYKETRRRHPLLSDEHTSIMSAISAERNTLEPAKQNADYIIDTSMLSASQLRGRVRELFEDAQSNNMVVTVMSFGFKYGVPVDSDFLLDVRCLPNPFYVAELRDLVGTDKPVRDYVMSFDAANGLSPKLLDMLDYMIPLYISEGKSQLVLSIGCTGGKHRSVVFAELVASHLNGNSVTANISHRDILRK